MFEGVYGDQESNNGGEYLSVDTTSGELMVYADSDSIGGGFGFIKLTPDWSVSHDEKLINLQHQMHKMGRCYLPWVKLNLAPIRSLRHWAIRLSRMHSRNYPIILHSNNSRKRTHLVNDQKRYFNKSRKVLSNKGLWLNRTSFVKSKIIGIKHGIHAIIAPSSPPSGKSPGLLASSVFHSKLFCGTLVWILKGIYKNCQNRQISKFWLILELR